MANMKPIFTGNFGNTTPTDLLFEIGRGTYKGITCASIIGYNPNITAGKEETVWSYSGVYNYPTADVTLYSSSSDTQDTNIRLRVTGITSDYKVKTKEYTHTTGQGITKVGGPVEQWFRIFAATVVPGGVVPKGDIYITDNSALADGVPQLATAVYGMITLGLNTTQAGVYTVPVGHTLYATRLNTFTRKNKDCVVKVLLRPEGYPGFVLASQYPTFQGGITINWEPPLKIEEKTDIQISATTLTNNTQIAANLGYILIDNSLA